MREGAASGDTTWLGEVASLLSFLIVDSMKRSAPIRGREEDPGLSVVPMPVGVRASVTAPPLRSDLSKVLLGWILRA